MSLLLLLLLIIDYNCCFFHSSSIHQKIFLLHHYTINNNNYLDNYISFIYSAPSSPSTSFISPSSSVCTSFSVISLLSPPTVSLSIVIACLHDSLVFNVLVRFLLYVLFCADSNPDIFWAPFFGQPGFLGAVQSVIILAGRLHNNFHCNITLGISICWKPKTPFFGSPPNGHYINAAHVCNVMCSH